MVLGSLSAERPNKLDNGSGSAVLAVSASGDYLTIFSRCHFSFFPALWETA